MDTLIESLRKELEKIVDKLSLRIIELSPKRGKNEFHIHVVVDKDGGITLHDCEKVTRLLNDRLETLKLLGEESYSLRVSSPGIDRVFKDEKEYDLFKDRDVKVILKEPLDENHRDFILRGNLQGLENGIVILVAEGQKLSIPLEKISKTKLDS